MSAAVDRVRAPSALTAPVGLRWLLIVAGLDLIAGVWLAQLVQQAPPARHSDAALRVAALAALPLPAVLLQWLTLPVHGAARRWLGESAEQTVDRTLGFARRALWAALALPAGVALAALAAGELRQPLLQTALLAALAQVLAAGLGAMALLMALGAMASGGKDLWQTLSGGGAFGPAQAAPLLYAPAGALVTALVPVAVLTALWGARADLLGLPLLVTCLGLAALAMHRGVVALRRSVGPHLHTALLRVEVQDSGTGGHPLGRPIGDEAAAAVRVLMREAAVDHVGDRLEPAVRVPVGAAWFSGGVFDLAHLVHVHERVEVCGAHPCERPDHRKPFALEPARA